MVFQTGFDDSVVQTPSLLTFERLVAETAYKLELAGALPGLTPEDVRAVLQDAGVDETIRHAMPVPKGRLLIDQILIVGDKRLRDGQPATRFEYKRKLNSGLSAWIGQNGAGKSTILNSAIWALTGSDSGLSKRVRSWINDLAVWFSVGDVRYTSRVNRQSDGGYGGGIYQDFVTFDQVDLGVAVPVFVFRNRDEMRDKLDLFFMEQFGITTLRWTMHSSEKDDPDLHAHSTTWRTYAHAIHIEDDSYDDLIIDPQKGYGRQDRKILEMMLGVDHARVVAEIQVQADFAKEAYGRARSRVGGKQAGIADQITLLEQELADVTRAVELMQTQQTPVEDDSALVEARSQRAALLAEQNRLAAEITTLEARPADLERSILALEREKVALREQSEVEYLINSLAVVRCPHCESAVDDEDRLVRERSDHTCHVCNQPITKTRTKGDLKALLRERDDEIGTLRKAIKGIRDEIATRQADLDTKRDEVGKLNKVLETSVTQARQGFTTSYANLLLRKGQIEGQIAQLRRSQTEIDHERQEVETAGRWYTILQTASEIADESVFSMYQNAFGELSALVTQLATEFGVPDLERVFIDEKRYIKLLQGGVWVTHNDLARSERVKFKVAFHLALMLLQTRSGLGKHPGFLIIDTPGTAEVDSGDLIAMAENLQRIHEHSKDQVQIFLASAREEILTHLPDSAVERPAPSGTFF